MTDELKRSFYECCERSSLRISFAKNSEGALEVTDTNNYYPFGLNHIAVMLRVSGFGDYYSLAEASGNHYGNNNPIRFIDPDGRLTVDNLQGRYTRGSAVADFMQRSGLAGNEQNMPLFYRDEGWAMIRTEAVGNDGQGGG